MRRFVLKVRAFPPSYGSFLINEKPSMRGAIEDKIQQGLTSATANQGKRSQTES